MKRRHFIKGCMGASLAATLPALYACSSKTPRTASTQATPIIPAPDAGMLALSREDLSRAKPQSRIALVRTSDRRQGIARGLALLGLSSLEQGSVFLKPNFNSADRGPASTHEETLLATIEALRELDAGPMTLGDRSGMGDTREVMTSRDIFTLGKKHHIDTLVFDEFEAAQWRHIQPEGTLWKRGFYMPTTFLDADFKVMMCCLKTHQYGGHFTMSLKNAVGLAAQHVPGVSYDFMRELHRSPIQRTLIADLNASFTPDLIIMDGVEAFVDGGPAEGDRSTANMMLMGTDRVAMDMLGVAMLRELGTNDEVSTGAIADLDQLARAIELDLGQSHASGIDILTDDDASHTLAHTLLAQL